MSGEVWKPIYGFTGLYEVSSLGRVRSLDRTIKTKKGSRKYRGRIIKYSVNHKGYAHLIIYKNTIPLTRIVHRLVAKAFIPNPKKLPQVNHIDGNKLNNAEENVEWVDNRGNQRHSLDMGLRKTKLTKEDVLYIRKTYLKDEVSYSQLGRYFGVDQSNIYRVVKRQTWKHI